MLNKMFPKKQTDNRSKNPSRKISSEVAEFVIERDRLCILCENSPIQALHHVYYGLERQFDKWRNWIDRLVWLCNKCHYGLHFTDHVDYRKFTKDYLKKFYD